MIEDVLHFETCIPKKVEVVINTQYFIGSVAQLVKTEVEKNTGKEVQTGSSLSAIFGNRKHRRAPVRFIKNVCTYE